MKLVYLVSNDKKDTEFLKSYFHNIGFRVETFRNQQELFLSVRTRSPDLLIIDHSPPDIESVEISKKLKILENADIPIIIISSVDSEIDKVLALELGADDYISKPYSIRELVARAKAILRRYKTEKLESFRYKDILLVPENFEVKIEGKSIKLSPIEYKILYTLLENQGKEVPRKYIADRIPKMKNTKNLRIIDVHIKKLRDKLGNYGDCIKTIYGVGYKWSFDKKKDSKEQIILHK